MGRANHPAQPRSASASSTSRRRPPTMGLPPVRRSGCVARPRRRLRRRSLLLSRRMTMQQEDYAQDYPSAVHPLHRYAAQHAAPEPDYLQGAPFTDAGHEPVPSRYDDALYGQIDPGAQASQFDPAFADDAYAYQDGYGDGAEEPVRKRGGGMVTVAVVLALAVVGTGGAFAYRTYVGSPRSGEPPIIKADNSPTKIMPAPSSGSPRCRTAWRPATARRRSFRARKPRSTSMPGPVRGRYFRR